MHIFIHTNSYNHAFTVLRMENNAEIFIITHFIQLFAITYQRTYQRPGNLSIFLFIISIIIYCFIIHASHIKPILNEGCKLGEVFHWTTSTQFSVPIYFFIDEVTSIWQQCKHNCFYFCVEYYKQIDFFQTQKQSMGNQLCNHNSAIKEKEIPEYGDFSVSNFQHYYTEDNIEKANSLTTQATSKIQLLSPTVASRNLFGESQRKEKLTRLKMSYKKFGKKSKQIKDSSHYHLNPITFSTFCSIQQVGVQSEDHVYSHSWLSLEGSLPYFQEEFKQPEKGVSCVYDYLADWIKEQMEVDITKEQFIRIRKGDIAKDYLLKEKLGQGAFGQVFKCQSILSGAERAVKVLKRNILMDPRVKQQFIQQFTLLKRIDHPNIIKIYEIYQQPTCMFIITELCIGGTLSSLMKMKPILPQHLIKAILLQLFQAVAYLHGQRILHRDIKPDNVVFVRSLNADSSAEDVNLRLIDFGLASEEKQKIFGDWAQIGTRSYMAPQVYSGIYSRKCDAWSCGIIMHIMLLGFNPFKIDSIEQKQPRLYYPSCHDSRWQSVNNQQKNIIIGLLDRNYATRMDVAHALKEPYFTVSPIIPDPNIVNKLYRYSRGNNLVATVQRYLSLITTTQENAHQSAAIFRSIDTDQDGIIKRHELNAYLCKAGLESEQADYVFRKLDQNHSGGVDFGELLVCLQQRKNLFTSSKLLEAFQYIDLNRNGTLEKQELKFFLRSLEKKQIDQLLKQIEKTGKVNFTAFQSYLQQERWL